MRILVLGAGAVGGYFGGRMIEGGADVTFLVREKRRTALARDGLVVRSPAGDLELAVKTVTSGERLAPFDVVLLSCKAYDLDGAMDSIAPAVGRGTAILPLLNGLAHIERLTARFGADRVLGGCCYAGITLDDRGVIRHVNRLQRLVFGELAGGRSPRTEALATALVPSGLEVVLSEDILQQMWEKWFMLAALAGASTLMRGTVGEILAAPSGEGFMLAILDETAAVARSARHEPSRAAFDRARALLTERGSPFAASLFHDMQKGVRTEGEQIIGDLLRYAAAGGVDAPILRTALVNLEAYEAKRAKAATPVASAPASRA